MIVNRYITALLVVLAATGLEAQTYQQALKFALTDISYDEFIQQPEAKALEDDLLCVIKAIKAASADESTAEYHWVSAALPVGHADILAETNSSLYFSPDIERDFLSRYGSIVIRGPDFLPTNHKKQLISGNRH